ncbi:MAG: nucleotide exchange factor GrpE, partial [Cyclobacteriaceae bacterium]|nr:nucleotide exchange factor GrpE [Cyclobacteriaceae bacterium]
MKKKDKTEETAEKQVNQQEQEVPNENEPEVETKNEENSSEEEQPKNDELAEMKEKYLRLYSEFENFRRRTAKEKLLLMDSANESLITELIPVLNDFERARDAAGKEESPLSEGLELIFHKYKKVLTQAGLKEVECGKGSDFDPDLHEAISQIPVPEEDLKGKIVDVIEKGYLLKEKVVRFAK